MSLVSELWKIIENVASLTKGVERATKDIIDLRRDLNTLTLIVTQLKSEITHEKATTKLVLDGYEKDGKHLKESIESRFDVLVTRLDSKIATFESRMSANPSEKKSPLSLESDLDD